MQFKKIVKKVGQRGAHVFVPKKLVDEEVLILSGSDKQLYNKSKVLYNKTDTKVDETPQKDPELYNKPEETLYNKELQKPVPDVKPLYNNITKESKLPPVLYNTPEKKAEELPKPPKLYNRLDELDEAEDDFVSKLKNTNGFNRTALLQRGASQFGKERLAYLVELSNK